MKYKSLPFIYFFAFFFLLKPDYFAYLGKFTILYNCGTMLVFAIILFFSIKKKKKSKVFLLVLSIIIYPFTIGIMQGAKPTNSVIAPLIQSVGLAFLLEYGTNNKFVTCAKSLSLVLEIYTYINFFSIIFFPNGLYDVGLYSGMYWFLGYKNVMVRFILPAICARSICDIYKYEKYTFRTWTLALISFISLWMVDNKTGALGVLFVILLMKFLSNNNESKIINLKNAILAVFVLSFILAGTSLLDVFTPMLEYMGETASVASRKLVWRRTLELFIRNPLFGYGIRSSSQYQSLLSVNIGWTMFSHPHNLILYTLLQGGVIQIFLIYALFNNISIKMKKDKKNKAYKTIVFMYISFLLMGITESMTGATLLYPMAILVEGIYSNPIEIFEGKKLKRKVRVLV